MSGIAGIIKTDGNIDISEKEFNTFFGCILVNNCTEKVVTRINTSGFVGLGELAGKTPKVLCSKNEMIKIFVWGELFFRNSLECESSKSEILFEKWDKQQEKFVDNITGNFVIFIFDKKRGYYLFNSLFGMMPIYYSLKGSLLYFSSRIQSFIDLNSFVSEIDKSSLLQYLIFNYSINDSTYLKDVKLLPAASIIKTENGRWKLNKYNNHLWLLNSPTLDLKKGKKLVSDALERAIIRITSIDKPFGCSITGGWDGRLVLSYLTKNKKLDYFLYTYGKDNNLDMNIARKLKTKFGFKHIPVLLDQEFINSYGELATETSYLSGATRAANRGHYILMAKILSQKTRMVISGNCGSNILKIIQGSSSVYNEHVLNLFKGDLYFEDALKKIYFDFFSKNPWVKRFISFDHFCDSLYNNEIIHDKSVSLAYRFYHYLLTNIERKYFGSETASYSSYIYNYSPFIDAEFIETIINTPFYGGHYTFLEKNPFVRIQLIKLYAEIMVINNSELARFTSDRGFPISWFLNPLGRVAGLLIKKMNTISKKGFDPDPFNHVKALNKLNNSYCLADEFFINNENQKINDTLINALSWSNWYSKYLINKS
ncbi:MAG: hypothetical protein JXC36_07420 [Candidatus Atribacteria bacterium]|nr:hypothetical protein [Candidatus Atribacteria bacterium]